MLKRFLFVILFIPVGILISILFIVSFILNPIRYIIFWNTDCPVKLYYFIDNFITWLK